MRYDWLRDGSVPVESIIGIDPGVGGAVAALWLDDGGEVCGAAVVQLEPILIGTTKQLDESAAIAAIRWVSSGTKVRVAVVEEIRARPGQGASGMWWFAQSIGALRAICRAFGYRVFRAQPQSWRAALGLPVGSGAKKSELKGHSLELARSLNPRLSEALRRKKDADIAEALLLAEYGRSLTVAPGPGRVRPRVASAAVTHGDANPSPE